MTGPQSTCALGLYAALLFATPTNGVAQGSAKVEQVAWLTGCWEYKTEKRTVEEHWMAPRGHTMLGAGRTVQGEKLLEFEMVLIREQDGQLAYESRPSAQPMAVFLSRTIAEREVVFENLQHDFPQRIGYTRDGDSLRRVDRRTAQWSDAPDRVSLSTRRLSRPLAPRSNALTHQDQNRRKREKGVNYWSYK